MKDDSVQTTVTTNVEWFKDNDAYAASQASLEHYQHIARTVARELRDVKHLLDIGNGGFFNYDTSLPGHVTAVDLFLQDGPGPLPHTTLRSGSLLDLPFADQSFDCVLIQNVFHHVTGRSVADNHLNLKRGMQELFRCLRPGGKAVIVESTVGSVFYRLEALLFAAALFVKRRGHPVTFQFTPRQLLDSGVSAGFVLDELCYFPRGRYILQLGYKWPSVLTPARPVKLILVRPSS